MNKRLIFCTLLGSLTACQRESDIQPGSSSLSAEVAGTYQTNAFADVLCVALEPNQMPSAELKPESDSTVTLIYTKRYPTGQTRQIRHIGLTRQGETVQLQTGNLPIGSFQNDRVFTNSGMEIQGKVLRIAMPDSLRAALIFTGYRP